LKGPARKDERSMWLKGLDGEFFGDWEPKLARIPVLAKE
jgi:hypothetical protein